MQGASIGGLIFIIVVAAILYFAVEGRDARLKREAAAYVPPRQVAIIEGTSKLTDAGQLCAVLLVFSILVSMVLYAQATTVFQQIQAGVAMITGILLFGLGVALLRKSTYTVFEIKTVAEPPPVPSMPEKPLHDWKR